MKQIVIALMLCLGVGAAYAQDDVPVYSSTGKPVRDGKVAGRKQKGFDASRLIFGGGFGFGFGNVTNINIAPAVGYRISDRFSAGIGMGYQYVRVKNYYPVFDASYNTVYRPFTANVYSPSLWTRYILWNNVFAHIEYEHNFMSFKEYYNNYTVSNDILTRNVNYSAPSILVGGGIRHPISDRVSIIFQGLYDILPDKNSPYRGTIAFRFGILAGF